MNAGQPELQDQQAVERADQRADREAHRDRRPRRASPCRGRSRWPSARTSDHASAGARPIVDSSDRSNLPLIRISDSASTSRDSSVCCCSTLIRLAEGQEHRVDEIADDQQRDDHRDQREVAQPGAAGTPRAVQAGPAVSSGLDTDGGLLVHAELPRLMSRSTPSIAATRCGSVQPAGSSACTRREEHDDPVADPQVLDLVGHHQHPGAPPRHGPRLPSSDSRDRTSTPTVGLISTSAFGSLASARAITTFCALPPDRPATGWSGPSVLIARSSMAAPGQRPAPARADETAARPTGR